MQNLKITFSLGSPVMLDRTTSIDSILLSAYYAFLAKNGRRMEFDPEHKSVKFIHREHGVFSGSIWYIDRANEVHYDFNQMIKKPEYKKIFDATGKKTNSRPSFKAALLQEEIMLTDEVYFYIKGEKEVIEKLLLAEVDSIGKKSKLGFGTVTKCKVEEIDVDKGFMLNATTPSKPLPVVDFDVNTKKIAYFRRVAPYWLDEGKEACYMPTTALYEVEDTSAQESKYVVADDLKYISNVNFLYKQAQNHEWFEDVTGITSIPKKKECFEYKTSEEEKRCAFSGELGREGVHDDIKSFMLKERRSFGDHAYIKNDSFVSKEALWCIYGINKIAYALVDREKWMYLQGSRAEEGKRINDYLHTPEKFLPPFSINLKDTANAQHVSFKGAVSISNAYFVVQYGDKTLYIDSQMLGDAIADIQEILANNTGLTKSHLCGNFLKVYHAIPRKNMEENLFIVQKFQKKYDQNLRTLLSVVAF